MIETGHTAASRVTGKALFLYLGGSYKEGSLPYNNVLNYLFVKLFYTYGVFYNEKVKKGAA